MFHEYSSFIFISQRLYAQNCLLCRTSQSQDGALYALRVGERQRKPEGLTSFEKFSVSCPFNGCFGEATLSLFFLANAFKSTYVFSKDMY